MLSFIVQKAVRTIKVFPKQSKEYTSQAECCALSTVHHWQPVWRERGQFVSTGHLLTTTHHRLASRYWPATDLVIQSGQAKWVIPHWAPVISGHSRNACTKRTRTIHKVSIECRVTHPSTVCSLQKNRCKQLFGAN